MNKEADIGNTLFIYDEDEKLLYITTSCELRLDEVQKLKEFLEEITEE